MYTSLVCLLLGALPTYFAASIYVTSLTFLSSLVVASSLLPPPCHSHITLSLLRFSFPFHSLYFPYSLSLCPYFHSVLLFSFNVSSPRIATPSLIIFALPSLLPSLAPSCFVFLFCALCPQALLPPLSPSYSHGKSVIALFTFFALLPPLLSLTPLHPVLAVFCALVFPPLHALAQTHHSHASLSPF